MKDARLHVGRSARLRRAVVQSCRRATFIALLFFPAAASSQIDPSGTWRTLHTQHFRLHFRPALRPLAVVAANEAERAYSLLSSELHPPRGIIDLTLSDDVDTPNGFALDR